MPDERDRDGNGRKGYRIAVINPKSFSAFPISIISLKAIPLRWMSSLMTSESLRRSWEQIS